MKKYLEIFCKSIKRMSDTGKETHIIVWHLRNDQQTKGFCGALK